MANLQANPWTLISTDPATATITSSTGLTLNADGTVSITTTAGLTFNTSYASQTAFTVIGSASTAYIGFYQLIIGASGGSAFTMKPQFSIPAGTAQSGGGTLIQCAWPWEVRIEDISWQNASGAGQLLNLYDRNGNPVWVATATAAGSQNRGKVFWVAGLSPQQVQSGSVLITVD